jgi:hypothetical protein
MFHLEQLLHTLYSCRIILYRYLASSLAYPFSLVYSLFLICAGPLHCPLQEFGSDSNIVFTCASALRSTFPT